VVHRDLALRNILVADPLDVNDPTSVNLKVSDFGLSREQHNIRSRTTGCGDQYVKLS
jgi:serine/threonine protein kinase